MLFRLTVNKFQKLMVSPVKSPFKSPVKKRMRTNETSSTKKQKDFELFCCNDFLKNLPSRSNKEETLNACNIDSDCSITVNRFHYVDYIGFRIKKESHGGI